MENPATAPTVADPDVLTRRITLTSTDEQGVQWSASLEGISSMELPTILRLVANITEKALTGGR
jgi:hypothetical protein